MVLFARRANRDSSLVNWFGLVTALGGAASFELLKYAVTIRDRHLSQLAVRINVTPARVEELRALTGEVKRTRQMHAALSAAVEFRARELLLARQHAELESRAAQLKSELEVLAEQEHRLTLNAESKDSEGLIREVQQIIDAPGPQRNESLELAMKSVSVVVPGGGIINALLDRLVTSLERYSERSRARRMRVQARDVAEHVDHDRKDEAASS